MSKKNIEDIYPLSPLQQGMLFHSLFEPNSGVYIDHAICDLGSDSEFDLSLFKQAWMAAIQRHGVLRTAFVWEERDRPLQLVLRQVKLPLTQEDWRGLSTQEQEDRLKAFLAEDRNKDFDMAKAPLMRLSLLRTSDTRYKLVWAFHHILMGGPSYMFVLRDVLTAYDAFARGLKVEMKSARPFRDYISWLRAQDMARAERYWRDTLKEFTLPTPIGVDTPASKDQEADASVGVLYSYLSEAETASLNACAKQCQVTPSVLLQGAWAILLSRYSGEQDIVYGLTISSQSEAVIDTGSMVGLFINTLPLRVRLPRTLSAVACLKAIQKQQAELNQFDYTPLPQAHGWSEVPRGVPLFESVVVYQNLDVGEGIPVDGSVASLKALDIQYESKMNYPLSLVATPGRKMKIKANFYNRRFNVSVVKRMLGHLTEILKAIAADPSQNIARLNMLTAAERIQLINDWNDTAVAIDHDRCIHDVISQVASSRPDSIAVSLDSHQLSYAELDARSNQLAHFLLRAGIQPDALVGILMPRGIQMVIAVLGTLKAGAGYVPLDPEYPPARLQYMVEDSRPRVALSGKESREKVLPMAGEVICLDDQQEAIGQMPRGGCGQRVCADNAAYVIYTSGSTGKPKGIVLGHRGLVNMIAAWNEIFGVGEGSRLLQFASLSFDASVWEVCSSLAAGGRLIFASRQRLYSGEDIEEVVKREQVEMALLPPSLLSVLSEESLGGVKSLASIGEKCGEEVERRWRKGRRFYNAYGPAEATITVSVYESKGECVAGGPPIGKPLWNQRMYVLDGEQEPVAIGVAGEMYIGGKGLGRGYIGQAGMTAEKFVPDGLSGEAGGRLYRAGDMGRYGEEGDVGYIGRGDRQVKVKGYRIELGEVEAALRKEAEVKEAVVEVKEREGGKEKRLVAYIVGGEGMKVKELREKLSERLPEYMAPSAYVRLEKLPLSPNGKIDRRALPDPDWSNDHQDRSFVPPRNEKEKALADIWAQALGVPQIGVNDNFFDLGGDSILSIQIIARARQAGLQLTPKQLFQHQTIASLAEVVASMPRANAKQGIITGEAPLTPIQQWFFDQSLAEAHHYNQSILLEAADDLPPELIQKAVELIITHHDGLRLRFERGANGWRQRIDTPTDAAPFRIIDLSIVAEPDLAATITAEAAKMQAGLNLSERLAQFAWFRLPAGKSNRLLIIVHHLAVDGVSWRILLEDLQTACAQLAQGQKLQLPAKTTSLKEWAERLAQHVSSGGFSRDVEFWRSAAAEASIRLPVDYPGGANDMGSARNVSVALSHDSTEAFLHEVPEVYKTQSNDLLLTALALTLWDYVGNQRIRLALEGHGREPLFEDLDMSRTIGWFTTIFPVVLDPVPEGDLGDLIKSVKEQARRIPHKGVSYGALCHLSNDAGLEAKAMAEISFNYFGQFDQTLPASSFFKVAAEAAGPSRGRPNIRPFLIDINCAVAGGQLQVVWTYSENLHQEKTIEILANGFIRSLETIISHCLTAQAGGYTPSDFPDLNLDQQKLDRALAEIQLDGDYAN